jgi:hypothetical protein
MASISGPASIGFPHASYHPEWRLMTWHPHGTLDDAALDQILTFTQTMEQLADSPFDRYIDFNGLREIRVQIGHVFDVAEHRSVETAGLASVKSAFCCDKVVGLGMARMYEALMAGSSIQVRAFRERAAAAHWLGVPEQVLVEDVAVSD